MINYTNRLDSAIRRAAWAHEQQHQHRRDTDIPYIIHPFGVLLIASNYTDDEDTLIACLLHDVLEDVDNDIYNAFDMGLEFGEIVVSIVKDVTKDENIIDWRGQSNAYLDNLTSKACSAAIIVCAADKMHNLQSTLIDYEVYGDDIWERFSTKNAADQLWWYESVLGVVNKRSDDQKLCDDFTSKVAKLKQLVAKCSTIPVIK